ncbi:Uncharacterised protein [BD1-7 clade bacterium]|uniref:DUF1439 domain-containing protein n=1 Tax=BD1-7 clade bacterium TaxID=2029982 RepID=A0A5S9QJR7_9GAMM|nr:Uncharacterised protein [BD1-7 clade bacterium]CAA0118010.1 Uncharacterised protein [BD1-7 clade bacterium]
MKYAISAIAIIVTIALASYFYVSGKEYLVELSEEELHQKFKESVPYKKNYLFVIDVFLKNPRLELLEENNRVKVGLDVTFNIIVNDQPFGGSLDVSGGVKYSNKNGGFYLDSPAIEQLDVTGVPPEYTDQASKYLEAAVKSYYEDRPIYVLSSFKSDEALAKMVLKSVEVKDKKLLLQLGL